MCQQPWKENRPREVHNGSVIPINWTLLNRRFYFPVKEMPISRVKLWLPWEPRGNLCRLPGWVVPLGPMNQQSGAQKLPVALPTLSLALPSRLSFYPQSHLHLSSLSPQLETTTIPSAEPQPRPLALGHAQGSVPSSLSLCSRVALAHDEQATNPSDHITRAEEGQKGWGVASLLGSMASLPRALSLVTLLRKKVKATSQPRPHTWGSD